MLVTAFQMDDLAKQTLSHHIQRGHHIAAVTNIFQSHIRDPVCSEVFTISQ